MKVLDLFSGLGGWSQSFKDRNHDVITVDIEPKFNPSICIDILDFVIPDFEIDTILASPPCTTFSTMRMGSNWKHSNEPKTIEAENALILIEKTIEIIEDINPRYFVIENPRARLRTLGTKLDFYRRVTITQCRYGINRMKPTDLWGGFPLSWKPRELCWNYNPDHQRAWRGSMTGTQGMDSAESAKIPYELSLEMCLAMEKDL